VGPEVRNTRPTLELSKIAEGSTGLTVNLKPSSVGHCPTGGLSPAWSNPVVRLTSMLPGTCTEKKSAGNGNAAAGSL
jgi:hypothetical protein